MGFCTSRHFVLTICILQLVATVERQIFDFLGYMWIPILTDFLNIVFVIFGFFGAHQYRPKYVISYCIWSLLSIAWNIFVICFYLNVGILHRDGTVLNLGTDSISWWSVHGLGCQPVPTIRNEVPSLDTVQGHQPVDGCLYEYVEVLHAAINIVLAVLGSFGGAFIIRQFWDDDDTFDFLDGFETKSPQHTALRPTYVRVASNASPLRSSAHQLSFSRPAQDGQQRSLTLNRGGDSIRLCRSEVAVDRMGDGQKQSSLDYPKVVPRNERRQPRPMSLYASTRFH